ncbi:serine--tRNA ligase, partial [Klebsiella pneumoniae]
AEVAALKDALPALEAAEAQAAAALDDALAALPNRPTVDVPEGADEDDNVVVHTRGTPPAFAFPAREHDAIGAAIGLDFETGVALAGARF